MYFNHSLRPKYNLRVDVSVGYNVPHRLIIRIIIGISDMHRKFVSVFARNYVPVEKYA